MVCRKGSTNRRTRRTFDDRTPHFPWSSLVTETQQCLICGTEDNPTVEHIIPRTLWKKFGLDPDRDDLARYRRTLCHDHNQATGELHKRTDMMDLIAKGAPLKRKTLTDLADWSIWVTLLLGLARGSGVTPDDKARDLLRQRFGGGASGLPGGIRVYAARVAEYAQTANSTVVPHMVALRGDPSVLFAADGTPIGYRAPNGPIGAAESIGLGKFALLVLGQTLPSGPSGRAHKTRLDNVAAGAGLKLIHPLPTTLPELDPQTINMRDVSQLFTLDPFGADRSLLPEKVRVVLAALTPE